MFSVITPAFNAEKFIGQAIESVRSQGYDDWEMIVIDDGSTDGTCNIVQQFEAIDPRIRLIRKNHGGVSQARNTGVSEAKFEWIALLDADDVFCDGKMKTQLQAAEEQPDVVLWGTYAYNIGERGERYDVNEEGPPNRTAFEKMRQNAEVISIKKSSALFRASLFRQLGGFDSQYDSAEDTELWNRMADFGPVIAIPEPLILYRFHSQSLSVRKLKFQYVCLRFLRERNRRRQLGSDLAFDDFMTIYSSRSILSQALDWSILHSNSYWRYAGIQLTNGNRWKGIGWALRAFAVNPPMISWRLIRKVIGKIRYR
jgi:glycosyltransferase involved in cell wall biosynthesis